MQFTDFSAGRSLSLWADIQRPLYGHWKQGAGQHRVPHVYSCATTLSLPQFQLLRARQSVSGFFSNATLTKADKEHLLCCQVVPHAFDPRTWEAEAGGSLNWRPAWSTQRNPVSNKIIPGASRCQCCVLQPLKHDVFNSISTNTGFHSNWYKDEWIPVFTVRSRLLVSILQLSNLLSSVLWWLVLIVGLAHLESPGKGVSLRDCLC